MRNEPDDAGVMLNLPLLLRQILPGDLVLNRLSNFPAISLTTRLQVAFDERCKIHDLLMEGVELASKKRGYAALADMKTKWSRKER